MKYKLLRSQIKRNAVQKEHILKDCEIVIDGRGYFGETYKQSGCQFILGGEYDRYAHYLKNTLKSFIESNITCYVIFNGGMKADIEVRQKIHQNVIDNTDAVKPGDEGNVYCEPIFVKDVCKEVLEEFGIKYFVAEYDSREAMFCIAKKLGCPVVTNNFEYSLYGVSCITLSSMTFNKELKHIKCNIYDTASCTKAFLTSKLMPIFLTLVDEDSLYFDKLPEVIACRKFNLLPSVLRWVRRQSKDNAINTITKNLSNEKERRAFLNAFEENVKLCSNYVNNFVVKYFERNKKFTFFDNDEKWFLKGVADGRIAIPYINLKNNGTFSGSWLIVEKGKEDAMLSAIDIVMHVYGLLTNSQNLKITFIGRKSDKSSNWEIEKTLNKAISNEALFETMIKGRKVEKKSKEDLFRNFIDDALPGFDFRLLDSVPEDCWILIITLVYFCQRNEDFNSFAHCILLSYVMLGPVSEKVGVIKRSNFLLYNVLEDEVEKGGSNGLTVQDCITATNMLMDFFYVDNIKSTFERTILHTLSEFQHCLQHMNYLNKICGEKIKSTIYHKAFNATFVYKVYLKIEDKSQPMKYFEKFLSKSPILQYFKMIEKVFEACLLTVHK